MTVTEIVIKNTSFTTPMFVSRQARKSPPMPDVAPLPYRPDAPSLEEQAALTARAEERVDSTQKPTGGNPHPRIVRMPRWQADGEPTAVNWVIKTYNDAGKALRADHASRMRDAQRETQRIVDEWSDPVPSGAIQPTAEQTLRVNLRERLVISGAMLATALLFGAYPFMPNALGMGVCLVLLGLVLGSVQPMIMSTLHQITPADRHGEALGLRLMSLNGSSVLMPLLFGSIGAAVGVSLVFWVVGAVVGAGSRLAWSLRAAPHPPGDKTTG